MLAFFSKYAKSVSNLQSSQPVLRAIDAIKPSNTTKHEPALK